jgi:hypothetical protein
MIMAITKPIALFQTSQAIFKVGNKFYCRLVLVDGVVLCVAGICDKYFFGNRLWLPARIKFITSNSIYENERLKSCVIEDRSKLEGIEANTFSLTGLEFVLVLVSVRALSEWCVSDRQSLSSVTFESRSRLSRIKRGIQWNWFG